MSMVCVDVVCSIGFVLHSSFPPFLITPSHPPLTRHLEPIKRVNKSAPTGAPVEWMEEPSYFFKLSAFEVKGFYTYQVLVNKSKRAVYIDSVQREPFTSIQSKRAVYIDSV